MRGVAMFLVFALMTCVLALIMLRDVEPPFNYVMCYMLFGITALQGKALHIYYTKLPSKITSEEARRFVDKNQ